MSSNVAGRPTFQLNISVGSAGLPDVVPPASGSAASASDTAPLAAPPAAPMSDNPLHLSNDVLMKFQRISADTS
ncbi:hypothetical protein BIW11_03731 [Tropilaelaps mercedesae]|uniref:Uncharacterized protein n=1 Tax=Tropilaelaps mercedesae TaxID=418985 RepID=A0A1V9XH40_9ACAR|nr:hypothetical protein BIW11_03731 [Tropilaelaps mercedesae]